MFYHVHCILEVHNAVWFSVKPTCYAHHFAACFEYHAQDKSLENIVSLGQLVATGYAWLRPCMVVVTRDSGVQ